MVATQSNKQRAPFELDVEDMDRHKVELRRFLEKAKRRFLKAEMPDSFETILSTILKEEQAQQQDQSSVTIAQISVEGSRRLAAFLESLVYKCTLDDQHLMLQETLRRSLLVAVRQSAKTCSSTPNGLNSCFFCCQALDGSPTQFPMDVDGPQQAHCQEQASIEQPAFTNELVDNNWITPDAVANNADQWRSSTPPLDDQPMEAEPNFKGQPNGFITLIPTTFPETNGTNFKQEASLRISSTPTKSQQLSSTPPPPLPPISLKAKSKSDRLETTVERIHTIKTKSTNNQHITSNPTTKPVVLVKKKETKRRLRVNG